MKTSACFARRITALVHVARSGHVNALHAARSGEHRCAGHERHLRAGLYRRCATGVAFRALIRDPAAQCRRLIGRPAVIKDFFLEVPWTGAQPATSAKISSGSSSAHATLAVGMVRPPSARGCRRRRRASARTLRCVAAFSHISNSLPRDHERTPAREARPRAGRRRGVRRLSREIGRRGATTMMSRSRESRCGSILSGTRRVSHISVCTGWPESA